MTQATFAEIRELEDLAFRAWPAIETIEYDGWLLRFSGGHTRRANSVNPHGPSTLPTGVKIDYCAREFAERRLPLHFRLTPASMPPDLDDILRARRFTTEPAVHVMTSQIEPAIVVDIEVTERPSADWLKAKSGFVGMDPDRIPSWLSILDRVEPATGFGTVRSGGRSVSVGFVVVDGGYAGLFDIATDPGERRRGHGNRLVNGLLGWAAERGARIAYLQVHSENREALGLYRRIGFSLRYPYWYRSASG